MAKTSTAQILGGKAKRKKTSQPPVNHHTVLPYIERTLSSRLEIEPHDMTNEIYGNILQRMRKLKEGRCNRYGFVASVTDLVSVTSAEIVPEDLTARAVFEVSFNCIMCIPTEGTLVVTKILRMNNSLVCSENGPMLVISQYDHLSKDTFDVTNTGAIVHKASETQLVPGTMIKVRIISRKYLVYDTNIKVLAEIVDIASDDEINKCYYDHRTTPISGLKNQMIEKPLKG